MKRILSALICFSFFNGLMASSIAPNFASNGMAIYNFNPAYFGQMNMKDSRFEFNAQTSYARNFATNALRMNYWNYPIFYKYGYYGCYGFNQTNFRQNFNTQTYSFNGVKSFRTQFTASNIKEWRLGYGGGFSVENVDQSVGGRHFNLGVSITRKGRLGSLSFGLNAKIDHYKGENISFDENNYGTPSFNINEKVYNVDFGIKYANRNEKFNIGLTYFNLKTPIIGYINDHGGGWVGGYSQSLIMPYGHFILLNVEQSTTINGKYFMKHSMNLSISQLRSNLSPEYLRCNTAIYRNIGKSNTIGLGLTIVPPFSEFDMISGGPSIHYQTNNLKFQYILQINSITGLRPLPSMMNELAISYML